MRNICYDETKKPFSLIDRKCGVRPRSSLDGCPVSVTRDVTLFFLYSALRNVMKSQRRATKFSEQTVSLIENVFKC